MASGEHSLSFSYACVFSLLSCKTYFLTTIKNTVLPYFEEKRNYHRGAMKKGDFICVVPKVLETFLG